MNETSYSTLANGNSQTSTTICDVLGFKVNAYDNWNVSIDVEQFVR